MKNKVNQQTIIDMFVEQMNELGYELSTELVGQLKDMEKRRMCQFTSNYIKQQCYPSNDNKIGWVLPVEHYYNETFGGNNEQR